MFKLPINTELEAESGFNNAYILFLILILLILSKDVLVMIQKQQELMKKQEQPEGKKPKRKGFSTLPVKSKTGTRESIREGRNKPKEESKEG